MLNHQKTAYGSSDFGVEDKIIKNQYNTPNFTLSNS